MRTRTRNIWLMMRRRCNKPTSPGYQYYGGRGIKVCECWNSSFAAFIADMGECPPGLSIDRIDNEGNYEPGNCRWATKTQQARNKRRNTLLTFGGKTQCISAWAEECGLDESCLHRRLGNKWPLEKALTTPSGGKPRPTHCKFGHELHLKSNGKLGCRTCSIGFYKSYRLRKKARAALAMVTP